MSRARFTRGRPSTSARMGRLTVYGLSPWWGRVGILLPVVAFGALYGWVWYESRKQAQEELE